MKFFLIAVVALFGGIAIYMTAKYNFFNGRRWKPVATDNVGMYALMVISLTIAMIAIFFYQ